MYFNSADFLLFISCSFLLYWFVFNRSIRIQNLFLVIASYTFYAFWDWRFLILIIISSLADYWIGIKIFTTKKSSQKPYLMLSIFLNLGILAFFKYFNFFIESFADLFPFIHSSTLNIVLPVGISFYTFQTLSYSIDIYRGKIKPTKNWIAFFAFVSFFPQLVAGPIERASDFLGQFLNKRVFSYKLAADGMRQFLWGLFKKVVIADNAAFLLQPIFDNYASASGSELIIAPLLFSFQIYGDFSGYSDMAIGISKLFGFKLKQNFRFPYFSRNIGEFWKRWHISLSTWFKDYLYIPLGGSMQSKNKTVRNLVIVFLVSALWHGANWTFICWGLLHVIFYLPLFYLKLNRKYRDDKFVKQKWTEILPIILTFCLVSFAWIFFRSNTVEDAFGFINGIFKNPFWSENNTSYVELYTYFSIAFMMIVEWTQQKNQHGLEQLKNKSALFRWSVYILITFTIYLLKGNPQTFIYFQF